MKAKKLMLILLCTMMTTAFTACKGSDYSTDQAKDRETVISDVERNESDGINVGKKEDENEKQKEDENQNQKESEKEIQKESEKNNEKDSENMQIANPWIDCDSMDDAVKIAGFSFEAPEQINGYPNRSIQAIENDIIQVIYDDGSNSVVIRKAVRSDSEKIDTEAVLPEKDDISGDYNEYSEINIVAVGDYQVTEKGNNGTVSVAFWNDGEHSFSVNVPEMDKEEIESIIVQVK